MGTSGGVPRLACSGTGTVGGRTMRSAAGSLDSSPSLASGQTSSAQPQRDRPRSGGRRAFPQYRLEQGCPAAEAEPPGEEPQAHEELAPGADPCRAFPPQVRDAVQDRRQGHAKQAVSSSSANASARPLCGACGSRTSRGNGRSRQATGRAITCGSWAYERRASLPPLQHQSTHAWRQNSSSPRNTVRQGRSSAMWAGS